MQSANAASTGLRHYAVVTSAYWGFTLTDGALRMLVLLHFYRLGYSPFTLAFLFLLYEFAGIIANLIGGWLATRFGITRMLTIGLITQICGFLLLSALSPDWSVALSVAWVVLAQGVCGVAKDLTKTASKSAIKITSGEASGRLFHWVAWFTGSKNAMKGIGFFLGGFMLDQMGFRGALWSMAGLLGLILIKKLADGGVDGVFAVLQDILNCTGILLTLFDRVLGDEFFPGGCLCNFEVLGQAANILLGYRDARVATAVSWAFATVVLHFRHGTIP